MLVRSLKCTVCGSHKVTEPKHMYIYCDYCGNWMGIDMKAAVKENFTVFTRENMNNPDVQQYNALAMEVSNLGKAKDVEGYINAQVKFHELEFKIFPMRHGPKGKQHSFQKKYIDYYKAYYKETVNEEFLEKRYVNAEQIFDSEKLTYTVENGVLKYEFNENFKEMIDAYAAYIKGNIEQDSKLECLTIHPEPAAIKSPEILLDMSLKAFIQNYEPNIAEKIVEYLGMEDKFIEIDDVNLSDYPCKVCSKILQIPEGATTVLCEDCGSLNELENAMIKCHNCGAVFDPKEKTACPYCETVFQKHGSVQDVIAESYQKSIQQTGAKKPFWKRLFGG